MSAPSLQINTLEVPVANLKRAIAWYQEMLGLKYVWSDDFHALLDSGNSINGPSKTGIRILLVETLDLSRLFFRNTNTDILHSVIDFQTDDLDSFYIYLKSKDANVDVLGPPANDWAPRGFAFFDSEGNRLGVYTYKT